MIVFNLSLANLYISGITSTLAVLGVLHGEKIFHIVSPLCTYIASSCLVACVTVFLNTVLLSFDRYIYVCYADLYKIIFSKHKTIFYCLVTYPARSNPTIATYPNKPLDLNAKEAISLNKNLSMLAPIFFHLKLKS